MNVLRDATRMRALERTGLLDTPPEAAFDRLTQLACKLLRTPVALVSLVDDRRQFFKSAVGLAEPWATQRETPLSHSYCKHAVATREAFVVDDSASDPRVRDNGATRDLQVGAYAGVPLIGSDQQALGTLCVIDAHARTWGEQDLVVLRELAVSVVTEIELRSALRVLRMREALFSALTESAQDAIVTTDARGRVLVWNQAAETLFGYSPEEMLGEPVAQLIPERYRAAHFAGIARVAGGGETRLVGQTVEVTALCKDGREFPAELSLARSSTEQGAVFTGIFRDITQRKVQTEALRRAESQLSLTIDNAPIGMALVGLDGRFVRVNKALCEIVQYDSDELVGLTFQRITHPDDLAADLALLEALLRGEIPRYKLAKRYFRKDGELVDVMIHVSLVRDRERVPSHFIAQIEDVSAIKRAEAELSREAATVRLLHTVADAANCADTSEGAMAQSLSLIASFLGWPMGHVYRADRTELIPTGIWHVADSARFAAFRALTDKTALSKGAELPGCVFATGQTAWFDEAALARAGARVAAAPCLRAGLALPVLVGSEVCAVLELYTDVPTALDARVLDVMAHVGAQLGRVVERERHVLLMRGLSFTDELTGLSNRRGFLALAEAQLRLANRTSTRATLFFIDLDGLKQINDHLGHDAGDAALRDMATVLKQTLRASDVAARLGGDEFVGLALDTAPGGADEVVARLQHAASAFNHARASSYALSFSVGTTHYDPEQPRSVEDLIAEADALMYEAKRQRKLLPQKLVLRAVTGT